jgi:hypothetical protein
VGIQDGPGDFGPREASAVGHAAKAGKGGLQPHWMKRLATKTAIISRKVTSMVPSLEE